MLSDKEIQQLQAVSAQKIQTQKEEGDTKRKQMEIGQRQAELASMERRDPQAEIAEYVGLIAKARQLREEGKIAEADRLMARADDMKEYRGKGAGGGGAGAGPKPMTRDQASDNVTRLLETFGKEKNVSLAEAKSALIASGIPNPTMAQIKEHLIQEQMKGVSLSPTAPSGVIDKSNPLLK
jgi:hypothetical protein